MKCDSFCRTTQVPYVRKWKTNKVTAAHIQQNVKHPDKKVFWACFSCDGPGELVPVQRMMCSKEYVDILSSSLVPKWKPRQQIFQQNLAPRCTSKLVQNFFKEYNINVHECRLVIHQIWTPSRICGWLWKFNYGRWTCTTKTKLISNVIELWFNDEQLKQQCNTLVNSMPNCVKELLNNKGGHISY